MLTKDAGSFKKFKGGITSQKIPIVIAILSEINFVNQIQTNYGIWIKGNKGIQIQMIDLVGLTGWGYYDLCH